ncbi:MAG: hypothetical protein R2822_17000 [Spirosomataceae bacterium]
MELTSNVGFGTSGTNIAAYTATTGASVVVAATINVIAKTATCIGHYQGHLHCNCQPYTNRQ